MLDPGTLVLILLPGAKVRFILAVQEETNYRNTVLNKSSTMHAPMLSHSINEI